MQKLATDTVISWVQFRLYKAEETLTEELQSLGWDTMLSPPYLWRVDVQGRLQEGTYLNAGIIAK